MSMRRKKEFSLKISRVKSCRMTKLARLLSFPNVLVTARQAFLTHEAVSEIARITVEKCAALCRQRGPARRNGTQSGHHKPLTEKKHIDTDGVWWKDVLAATGQPARFGYPIARSMSILISDFEGTLT